MAAIIQTILKPTKARALDTSGSNNHGQIYSGRALEFDGVTDYLNAGVTATTLGITNNVTVACWMNSADLAAGGNAFVWNFYQSTTDAWGIKFSGSTFKITNDIDNGEANLYLTALELNTWYRVTVVLDNLENKLYINGILSGSGTSVADGLDSYTSNIYLGNRKGPGGSSPFTGMLSDFQVWDAAFTAADALYDYNNPEQLALNNTGTSLTNSNLKLWYPMNDGHRGQQSYILDASNTGLGDDVVVNGDFNTDSDWTKGSGWSISDGKAIFTGTAFANLTPSSAPLISGKVYKITLDITVTNGSFKLQHNSVDIITESTTGSYSAYINSAATTFNIARASVGVQNDFTIDNIVIKPINDKNHATTVFHGDNTIVAGDDNRDMGGANDWAAYGTGTAEDVTTTAGKLTVTTTTASAVQGASLPVANAGIPVVGRTYRIRANLKRVSGLDPGTIGMYYGDVAGTITTVGGGGTNGQITDSEVQYETTIVAGSVTGGLLIVNPATTTALVFEIDDVEIKEIGTASGWTDADQQLDIPQTALQSYNQLAWFAGYSANTNATLDSQILWESGQTINMWVFPNVLTQYESIFGDRALKDYMRTQRAPGAYSATDEIFAFEMHDNVATDMRIKADTAGTLEIGKWLMWTFIFNSDRTIHWYENGEKKGDSIATADTTDGKKMEIKYFGAGYGASESPFEGAMTEISHYTDVLTQAEINDLYDDGKAKSALEASGSAGLSLYLRNNGLAEWKDLKGSNDANVDSTETILITAGADATRDSQGFLMNRQRLTNSLNLDYNQSYNLISKGYDTDNIMADGGSFSIWIYPTDMGGGDYGRIFEKGAIHYCFLGSVSGIQSKLEYTVKFSTSGICSFVTDNRDITLNKWNHIAVAYDGSATLNIALIYINGILVDSTASESRSGTISDDSAHDMYVGNRADFTRHFDGQIDDLNFYSDFLTAAEVKRNYNAGKRSHR